MTPRRLSALIALLLAALALAACGGSSDSGDATAASAGDATVSVRSIGGQEVLVDADGAALYTPAQEASGKVLCTGECTSVWVPLMARGSGSPTGAEGVTGTLETLKRPDGGAQVTYDGAPLYTFAEDESGEVTGDGVSDSFGGQDFSWHVVTPSGASSGSAGSSGGGRGYGSGGGGGGYSY